MKERNGGSNDSSTFRVKRPEFYPDYLPWIPSFGEASQFVTAYRSLERLIQMWQFTGLHHPEWQWALMNQIGVTYGIGQGNGRAGI
jgi:hypothetical protein